MLVGSIAPKMVEEHLCRFAVATVNNTAGSLFGQYLRTGRMWDSGLLSSSYQKREVTSCGNAQQSSSEAYMESRMYLATLHPS
jgi:hypothetical protein